MKFEYQPLLAETYIYHSRNLLMKFEFKKITTLFLSTTVEIY